MVLTTQSCVFHAGRRIRQSRKEKEARKAGESPTGSSGQIVRKKERARGGGDSDHCAAVRQRREEERGRHVGMLAVRSRLGNDVQD